MSRPSPLRLLSGRGSATPSRIRSAINLVNSVRISLAKRVIIGAGITRYGGWCATEQHELDVLDRSSFAKYWRPNSRRAFLAEHVWEHLSAEDGRIALQNCHDYLMPGGYLRLAVPDGYHVDPHYLREVAPGGSGSGANDHKMLYTYRELGGVLSDVGFQVSFLEYWDEHGDFHANDWENSLGPIQRSSRDDPRNAQCSSVYTSLIVDATRP